MALDFAALRLDCRLLGLQAEQLKARAKRLPASSPTRVHARSTPDEPVRSLAPPKHVAENMAAAMH